LFYYVTSEFRLRLANSGLKIPIVPHNYIVD
jgi:hypothetical protein